MHPTYAGFFLPVKVLSRVFRGKGVDALRRSYARNELDVSGGSEHLREPGAWRAFVDMLGVRWMGTRRLRYEIREDDKA